MYLYSKKTTVITVLIRYSPAFTVPRKATSRDADSVALRQRSETISEKHSRQFWHQPGSYISLERYPTCLYHKDPEASLCICVTTSWVKFVELCVYQCPGPSGISERTDLAPRHLLGCPSASHKQHLQDETQKSGSRTKWFRSYIRPWGSEGF